ncbi:Non-heme bromoperoxidase BPO-A2 [bacterium HR36]|nr:Non-heme bromoperoxidase BPO-A2 [bacterium HR36]
MQAKTLHLLGSQIPARSLPLPRFGLAVLRHYTAEYLDWGEGQPIVLIPGLAGGVGLVSPLAALLARDYRVLTYELRGETAPFALRQRFTLADLVDDLAEFVARLALECPVIMGVSFGGIIALQFAARYPARLAAVVAQGVDVSFAPSLLQRVAAIVLSDYSLPNDHPFVNQFFNLFFGKRCDDPVLFEFVTRQCWQTDQSVMAYRFRLAEEMNLRPYLPAIRVPALLLTGQLDILPTAAGLREMEQRIARIEHVRIAEAGHLAFVSHAPQVAACVRRFLRKLNCVPAAVE